jgi:hypothetical protein
MSMAFVEFLSPKIAIFRGETLRNCKKHEETTNLLGKESLNFKRWGNEYCCHAWRPWRQAKSCSTGDRPPTHYFNTGHRPGLIPWCTFLYPQIPGSGTGFGTDTFCHNPYVDGHKKRGSNEICKLHIKKCWKWGLEIHHFHFISNISYNIISRINLILGFNLSNA